MNNSTSKPAYFITSLKLLIIFNFFYMGASVCGPKFPNGCSCGNDTFEGSLHYIVNCTNTGLHNTSVLEFMPQGVEVLVFRGNFIPELPWNVFGSINNYENLKIVDMSNNHIREIRGKTYHHVQHVERLILNHNNLSISRDGYEVNHHHPRVFSNFLNLQSLHLTNAFDDNASPQLSADLHDIFVNSQLVRLQKLHLEQNEIAHFKDRKVFCDLPNLNDLHLGENNLSDLNFEIRCLKNLRFLDLERNKFENIKADDLLLFDELNKRDLHESLIIDFGFNPFSCDCNISYFLAWMRTTNVTVRNKENLMCFGNNTNTGSIFAVNLSNCTDNSITLNTINKMHFNTNPVDSTAEKHTALLIFILVMLSVTLFCLVIALVYISRENLKLLFTPLLDNVAKKVQYTSIEDEDCPEVLV